MNKHKFKAEMALHADTINELAEFLHIAPNTLRNKINDCGAQFTQSEIAKIKWRYSLDADAVDAIFFAEQVS